MLSSYKTKAKALKVSTDTEAASKPEVKTEARKLKEAELAYEAKRIQREKGITISFLVSLFGILAVCGTTFLTGPELVSIPVVIASAAANIVTGVFSGVIAWMIYNR